MAQTLTMTKTKEQIIRDLLNTFKLEGHDRSDYFASLAGTVGMNQGKENLDPEGFFSTLCTITMLHTCPEVITEVPDFPQFIKRRIQQYSKSVELLLTHLAETTVDENLVRYKRALLFYAPQLDQTWE
jgi:hypothetical protein